MIAGWVDPQPVGAPAALVLMATFALFTAALIAARRRAGGSGGEARRRSPRSLIGIAIQGLGIGLVAWGPVRATLSPGSPTAIVEAAAVLLLMGFTIGLFHASTRAMGRNWSVIARTRADHELVTSGPFAVIRHPIYVAIFALQIAFAIAFGHWRGLILGVPLYWLGTWLRVIEEEKLLRAQFGAAYDVWAARVKRFVPGVV